jgi:TonB-linked SusC/RagA family outer membrane protein
MSKFRWLLAITVAVALAPALLLAQEAATITGRVTNESGNPVAGAAVRIDVLSVGSVTGEDGTFRLVVPASRIRQEAVEIRASRVGLASQARAVTLRAGATLTQNFQLRNDMLELEGIVVTGEGTATTRERLTTAVSTVKSQEITQSREANVVAALAGKAPNVVVTSSAGDPGAGAYIQIRGAASIEGGTQPLFVVDGTPVDNSSNQIERGTAGTVVTNRAADINPNDVERVEILKGAAATAIYGARGANGVVLITTKSGTAGTTRATFTSTYTRDEVTQLPGLQTRFGQGSGGVGSITSALSWGPEIPAGTPTFNHAEELFRDGNRLENNLTLSGGSDRTTYYLSAGRLDHQGVVRGNQEYERNNIRLKGTHFFMEDLKVGGNIAYTESGGDFIQQGSNISGLFLGALRTPADFNNLPYRDPTTGLHRAYRCNEAGKSCPGGGSFFSSSDGRGYDNPFWIANEIRNEANVGRAFGNVNIDYTPASWLRVSYVLGGDYGSDERLTVFPKTSSDFPLGRLIRANFVNRLWNSNLTATATGSVNDNMFGSITVGQSLSHEDYRRNMVLGYNLIAGTEETDFAVNREGDEFKYTTRTDGYFVNSEVTLFDQLTLNGTARWDGSSTFGGDGKRFFYPGIGASWAFTNLPAFENVPGLSYGKIRASYGVSGRQPPVFSNVSAFTTGTISDGWVSPNGLETIYLGREGVISQNTLGNEDIAPERKAEWEVGGDVAFFDQRLALGVTYYSRNTSDAILQVDVPPSTGYFNKYANAAEFSNSGWEVTLDLTPVQMRNFAWTMAGQWAKNNSCVKDLAGTDEVYLAGFTGASVSVVSPEVNGGTCAPFGVFYGDDFTRFGRGTTVGGKNIDQTFTGWRPGDLYIGASGYPVYDAGSHILGDPNPDWTAGIRNTFTLFNNLRVSGLVDIKHGGDIFNGTKGALYFFGTHKDTEAWHGAGKDTVFPGKGPGEGKTVKLNQRWATVLPGSFFTGPGSPFIEDGGFVKLRDVSVSYTFDQPWLRRAGFGTMDVTVSGRNLRTWTDYTGIDPESNLTGQSTGRGYEYFNNPQTRSFAFTVNLSR